MKKILSLVVALLFTTSLSSFAQGNLQFNQVKRIKVTASVSFGSTNPITTITVPSNKVWKIESACLTDPSSGQPIGGYSNLSVDNQIICSTNTNTITYCPQLIWLPSGTYNLFVCNGTGSTVSCLAVLNAIEFNIVP